jgi:peptidoglycan/xylan/chitin deacetylase (PgdA/CDA1 family)
MIKKLIKGTYASRLGWRAFGPILRRPGVIVLMYHRILGKDRMFTGLPVESFAAQMRWVREHCDPIAPDQLKERTQKGRAARPPVLITFDDGYRDYHDLAYPVLKELQIPALVFVATSFLDRGGMIWTDLVQWASLSTKRAEVKLPWSGETLTLNDQAARESLSAKARLHLKGLPDEERQAALEKLIAELGTPPERAREMLSWDEVRATMPLTTYGGHSHTHPILSRLSRADAEREISTCKQRILDETGVAPSYFAYPNGRPVDYSAETQEILKANGFTTAFCTSEGIAGADSDWMAIVRLPGEAPNLRDFAWLASGLSRG